MDKISDKSRDMAWLNRERHRLQAKYPGKWLAVQDERVIAVGDELSEVRAAARKQGIDDPLFTAMRDSAYNGVLMIRGVEW